MNLISCDKCGTVFDANKLNFPEEIHNEDYEVDLDKGVWDSDKDRMNAYVKCFHCSEPILKP